MKTGISPGAGFSLRQAVREDLEGIMDLEVRGFPPGVVESAEVFARRLEVFPQGFLLLEIPGTPAPQGYLTAELWEAADSWTAFPFALNHDLSAVLSRKGPLMYIASMTVNPGLRGTGLGKRFFRAALDRLLSQFFWVEEIWLIVGENWTAAEKIYRECGFREVGRLPDFLHPHEEDPQGVIVMSCPRGGLRPG